MLVDITKKANTVKLVDVNDGVAFMSLCHGEAVFIKTDSRHAKTAIRCVRLDDGKMFLFGETSEVIPVIATVSVELGVCRED